MIKTEKGNVRMRGAGVELIADFACVTKEMCQTMLDCGVPADTAKTFMLGSVVSAFESVEANKPSESAEPKQDTEFKRSDPVWGFAKLVLEALNNGRD